MSANGNPLRGSTLTASSRVGAQQLLREHSAARVSFEGIPLLAPSLFVSPAYPFGSEIVRDPIEPDPFLRQWPNRPAFANPDDQTLLEVLSVAYHSHYLDSMASIATGASYTSAFGRYGAVPKVVRGWIHRGDQDASNGVDSYYSRFTNDVMRMVSIATEAAHIMIYVNNPLEYLQHGLGQGMGDEFAPRLQNPSGAAVEISELAMPPMELSALETTYADDFLAKQQEALRILCVNGYGPERLLQDHLNQHGSRTTP